jgi:prepilin-type N-terminal cleavage/methylation domain-containing protein
MKNISKRMTRPAQQRKSAHQQGFTLLEVMVALTITGIALGGLFGIIAGNKRLAWRSEESLVKTMQARTLINFSQLNDERGEASLDFENRDLIINFGYELEIPERKTQASRLALREYEVFEEASGLITSGTYWVELELAE